MRYRWHQIENFDNTAKEKVVSQLRRTRVQLRKGNAPLAIPEMLYTPAASGGQRCSMS